jgi:hypothetical protein
MPTRVIKSAARNVIRRLGYEIVPNDWFKKHTVRKDIYPDIDRPTQELFYSVQEITLSGMERVAALRQAVEYIVRHDIPGDIVECGVWKGGSMVVIAKTLLEQKAGTRKLYLFDTFSGMTAPTDADADLRGGNAKQLLHAAEEQKANSTVWAIAPLESVKSVMQTTGYDAEKVVYVEGRVEETIPAQAPTQISLLRLDTDWYESTYHELIHLFPRLSVGGVLLIDDYGHWQGARRAVDQYLAEKKVRVLLNRIDYTGRICVKVDP